MKDNQKLRLQRVGFATLTYIFVLLCVYLIQWTGTSKLTDDTWLVMIVLAITINALFALLIIVNLNIKLPDPSMTRLQIVTSAVWGMFAVIDMYEARPLVLMLYLPSFIFGAFKLDRKQFLELVAMLSAILGCGIFLEFIYWNKDINIQYQILIWLSFSLILIWFALFGSYINSTNRKLRLTNIKLETIKKELISTGKKLEQAAETDYLTGVLNRRAFHKQLNTERHGFGSPYTIILVDIDHFKSINDQYGHDIGDKVLIMAVEEISHTLRSEDILTRWGGEEFLIFLSGVPKARAIEIADRIRRHVSNTDFTIEGKPLRITVSLGLTQIDDLQDLDHAIKIADEKLYIAKRNGRNRLEYHV